MTGRLPQIDPETGLCRKNSLFRALRRQQDGFEIQPRV
jgi:hypothetical protein